MTDLVLEHLKKIQSRLDGIERELRDLKGSNATTLGMIGELVKATAREDERFAFIEARIERIEHRLELRDAP